MSADDRSRVEALAAALDAEADAMAAAPQAQADEKVAPKPRPRYGASQVRDAEARDVVQIRPQDRVLRSRPDLRWWLR